MKRTILKALVAGNCTMLVSAIGLTFASSASAATLDVTQIGSAGFWDGTAYDSSTGNYYQITDNTPDTVVQYGNLSNFVNNTGGTTLNIPTYTYQVPAAGGYNFKDNMTGTYFVASGGYLYGHLNENTNPPGPALGKWNLATGQLVASAIPAGSPAIASNVTATIPAGFSFTNGYNWGGWSAMSVLSDQTGMYVVSGGPTANSLEIGTLNTDLSITNAHTVNLGPSGGMGWGFMVNGIYFGGNSYNGPTINYEINASTGVLTTVNINLFDPNYDFTASGKTYINNADYDAQSNILYLSNNEGLFEAIDVTEQLGIGAVPELSTWAMMMLGFCSLGFTAYRRRDALRLA
jgi:autoaggregation protein RapA/B/C